MSLQDNILQWNMYSKCLEKFAVIQKQVQQIFISKHFSTKQEEYENNRSSFRPFSRILHTYWCSQYVDGRISPLVLSVFTSVLRVPVWSAMSVHSINAMFHLCMPAGSASSASLLVGPRDVKLLQPHLTPQIQPDVISSTVLKV